MRPIYNLIFTFLLIGAGAFAQTATLTGRVADESGAVVPGAKITVTGLGNAIKTATSDNNGAYFVSGLAPGSYTVVAAAPDLAMQPSKVVLKGGSQTLNLQLQVASTVQQVTVQESVGPVVSMEATNNAGQLVLRGEDLQGLSDDPDDLQADLEALAGPSAGPSGGSIFIDGFSGGELPPKSSIREIRINQNPFSPEYDHIGFGRIEIFTKPGTDKFRGTFFYNFANQIWNSRNPYSAQKADLMLDEFGGNVSGPITKRSSFTLDAQDNIVDNGSIVNAVTVNPSTFVASPFFQNTTTPQHRLTISPRVDYTLNPNNTLVIRYSTTKIGIQDANIGGFNLPERGFANSTLSQTVQATETAVIGAGINETRFQYYRSAYQLTSNTTAPSLTVLNSFGGGGATIGQTSDQSNFYELQNISTISKGTHQIKFGLRLRGQTESNQSPNNFRGSFTFGGGLGPQLDQNNLPISGTEIQITSIERYRRTLLFQSLGYTMPQIQALGGGPSQFSISTGNANLALHQLDNSLFIGDDWKLRPNLTLNLGMRYEMQTNIGDHSDWAPRIGFAYAPGGANNPKPKTVIRGGFGMFYDRFPLGYTLNADRFNGSVEQAYVVTNPLFFPNVPSIASLNGALAPQVLYKKDSNLHAPYLMQSAITWEQQLPSNTTLAVTYTNSRGVHELRSFDINAPLSGTYAAGSPVYPLSNSNPLLLMTTSGIYNQNQVVTNVNSKLGRNISLFGFYMLNKALSNTDGLGTYPSNPYSQAGEYGPASSDIRHRLFIGGSINTRWNLRFSPFIYLNSGAPFDITSGFDEYGTSLFNSRPGIAADPSKPGVVQTPYGLLDPNPTAGEKIVPRNFGRGPGQYTVNLRIAKTFGFGPEKATASGTNPGGMGGGPGHDHGGMGGIFSAPSTDRKYNLTISMQGRNLLNHTNPGAIIGDITSPLFGQANTVAGGGGMFSENANNRRLELQMRFSF